MSEQHLEEDLGIELGASADELFGNVFAAISPETFGEEAAEGDDPAGTPAGSAGSATAADQSAGAGTPAAAAGSAGAGGEPLVPANGGAEGTPAAAEPGDGSDVGVVAYADIQSAFGEISNALEDNATKVNQEAALRELQTEHTKYFDAIKLHPRMLVGQEVPSINGEGMETLRDSKDAQDWQEAVKQLLLNEVNDRAARRSEDDREMMTVLHGSIELFQRNSDLVPGTREFDKDLANEFARMAKPYEVRVDGKLSGYSVPVQGIVDSLRKQLVERRSAAATPPAVAPAAPAKRGAPAPQAAAGQPAAPAAGVASAPVDDGPQAGIPSKAGASSESEDFSALWGTLGLSNIRI